MAITLTDSAATKVRSLMKQQGSPEGSGLRVKVVGGGCSGLSYELAMETAPTPADKVFESQGVKIYLDPKSAMFITGTEIDWQETMMGAGFAFKNPLAKGTCGCGTSFTA
jgi:iron-sulfur cluster assembly accessory protein